ncbi:MAG TPA: ABC transporter permease [Dissulfurispiraceae bacterium]|nr:ABC transporter permease [Dissulfurispiraceae bacterium]
MFGRIRHMVVKEFVQTFREKRNWMMLFGTPLIQLFMFGYIVTTDVNNISTALYDLDRSPESRELARRLQASGYFTISHYPQSPDEIRNLLDRGKVLCAIQIDEHFAKDIASHKPAQVQVLVDGTDSNTAMIAMNYIAGIVTRYNADIMSPSIKAQLFLLDIRPRVWYNPDLKSRNYNVPGVIASIIMLMCLMLTSMAVVREREMGTMEQLMVSPIKPIELMLGKTIPFAVISFLDMSLVTAVGVFWFGITIKGSIIFLFLGTSVYLLSVLGMGLFLSTILRTQQQALMATMFFNMPAMLLSGFMFPIDNMPEVFQYLTYLNPLRYFLVIIRGIFLKGSGLDVLWPQILTLFLLGVIIIALSSFRFRKRLS